MHGIPYQMVAVRVAANSDSTVVETAVLEIIGMRPRQL